VDGRARVRNRAAGQRGSGQRQCERQAQDQNVG
jgi:hypothetical protein